MNRQRVLLGAVIMTMTAVAAVRLGGHRPESPMPASAAPANAAAPAPAPAIAALPSPPPAAPAVLAPAASPIPVAAAAEAKRRPDPVGSTPSVPGDGNANLRSVVAAAKTGNRPERLTPLIAPAPFDTQRFAADPQAYLDVVEPGRVYQSAAPGEGVPELQLVGAGFVAIAQGTATDLRVRSVPLAPVTFTSFDCGAFSNRLTSITVRADAQGLATASFTAPPGTLNEVAILAGSPLASGQVTFCVDVTPATAALGQAVAP